MTSGYAFPLECQRLWATLQAECSPQKRAWTEAEGGVPISARETPAWDEQSLSARILGVRRPCLG